VNYPLVGAFVLALGAVLIAGVLWLASGGALRQKVDLYLAIEDESVAGLNLNAPVKYNGVEVGQVREIHLDPANPQRVRLIFAIAHGTPIKVDTEAVLKTQGLTGIAYVELSGGAPGSAPLLPGPNGELPVIRTKPSLSARLENVLTDVLAKLDSTSANLNAVLSDENRRAITSALADIAAVAHTVAERRATIDAGLASAARTFEHGERLAKQLGPVAERLGRGADAVEGMGRQVAATSASAGVAVDAAGAAIQRFGNETQPELQRLMNEVEVLSASLKRLAEQTERNPASLLVGRGTLSAGPGESAPPEERP
jgi:phospholipid/cholesterol/gamma-HCH transport system substrate-binding protein